VRRAQSENLTRDGVVTTTDSWLLARLGAGYLTDASTASRTLLLDLDAVAWSPAACTAFGLDPAGLPTVADCAGISGETAAFGRPIRWPAWPWTSRPRCWPRAA
jgi:glycerol kinase